MKWERETAKTIKLPSFGVRRLAAALKAGSLLPAAAASRGRKSGAEAPHSEDHSGHAPPLSTHARMFWTNSE